MNDLLDPLDGRLCHAVPAINHLGYSCHGDAGRAGHVRHVDTLRERHADDDRGPTGLDERRIENVIDTD
ncbi:hypothetical protein GCM10009541_31010 [Micromonospora gifhornensis]|uniref:Uncharacterized protein n=1 Tax=Micromonospora gifhornensis TaxID=84594 RepID=A0ABQ4IFZ0_9ACTN|nr:hypothetical protein Vgi01_35010 [Micromonospora gifhornensis]